MAITLWRCHSWCQGILWGSLYIDSAASRTTFLTLSSLTKFTQGPSMWATSCSHQLWFYYRNHPWRDQSSCTRWHWWRRSNSLPAQFIWYNVRPLQRREEAIFWQFPRSPPFCSFLSGWSPSDTLSKIPDARFRDLFRNWERSLLFSRRPIRSHPSANNSLYGSVLWLLIHPLMALKLCYQYLECLLLR